MKNTALLCLLMILGGETLAQSEANNVAIAKKIFEAFNTHDWDKMLSYYDEDAVFEDPQFMESVHDKSVIITHHREMHAMFPDIRDDVKAIYSAGKNVVVEFVASGTTAQGEKFSLPICTIFTFKNGSVIRDATYYDKQ